MKVKEALMDQIEDTNSMLERLRDLIDQARVLDSNLYEMTIFSLEQMTKNLEEFLNIINREEKVD